MTEVESIVEILLEQDIELTKRELTSITKFVEDNAENNPFHEVSYTFDITPVPAKRPRTGLNGFYDPDQAIKKKFTKSVLESLGHSEEFIKKWFKSKRMSSKRGADEEDKNEAKAFIQDHCLFEGMCKLSLDIYLPIPKSMPAFKKKLALAGYIRPENKPDIDNYEKFIYDSINSIFYLDDGQIISNENNLFYINEEDARIDVHIIYRKKPFI